MNWFRKLLKLKTKEVANEIKIKLCEKVECTNCGAKILPYTAKKYRGLCAPCASGESIALERRLRKEKNQQKLSKKGVESIAENRPKEVAISSHQGRGGDGTVLGIAIAKGTYSPQAGIEKIGYFDPNTLAFCTFPGGKVTLLIDDSGAKALKIMGEAKSDPFVLSVLDTMFPSTKDKSNLNTVSLIGLKLRLSSAAEILSSFLSLTSITEEKEIAEFLMVTTFMPFFLTYSVGTVVVISEVAQELMLNALANLLLNDPYFQDVTSVESFRTKARSLLERRRSEYEKKKQWAIDFKKLRGA